MNNEPISERNVNNKKPAQWKIPPCIRHMPKMPLYLSISWWGFYRGVAFNRHDVSEAFDIHPNRVSTAMAYIVRRCEGHITFESNMDICSKWHDTLWVKIISIDDTYSKIADIKMAETGNQRLNKRSSNKNDCTEQLSKWYLKMPSGNSRLLERWKSNCPTNDK
ncbi:TPA: CaiF/GrlA family transcriptional regulator [Klebsiella quasipneumoniae subsp. similipneumoniae]|nr:CaiF/GrlA family transcriptional regulator [Klebsiella quasipneumoniae subsp. similipneumoniae]